MKRLAQVVSLVLLVALTISLFASAPAYASQEKVRVMVEFVPGQKNAAKAALNAAGGETHFEFDNLNTIAVSVPAAALNGLSHNPNVVMIEEDAVRMPIAITPSKAAATALQTVSLPSQTVPFGVDMVQARDVWDADRNGAVDSGAPTGANRIICIIDSGFSAQHEDLYDVGNANLLGGYTTISGGWSTDGSGHGSHVAGTISAINNSLGVIGVTPGTVKLYIVRVFGDDGAWAYASTLVDAANRCASAGANIISMSLGGDRSSVTEKNAFANLYSQNILSIAAAGNDGTTGVSYPAGYAAVMSVAAIDSNKVVADFSQKNSDVEIAAPGVGVLSSVPYVENNTVSVGSTVFSGGYIEGAKRGSASGALVNGGICDSTGAWSGKVVLCQRGTISFYDKVLNVKNGGGAAALLYNNVSGGFLGTLGDGVTLDIVALSLSMEDGQSLLSSVGSTATVASSVAQPASGYDYYDGTSMATPHASAVAALVWSYKPTATAAEIRTALTSTAQDLGTAGKDNSYGYGLVQAKAAIDSLGGGGGGTVVTHVADLDAVKTITSKNWKVTVTIKVVDANGAAVNGAVVSGGWTGAATSTGTCTTTSTGTCSIISPNLKLAKTTITFTVKGVTLTGATYNAAANSDPDGDSTGTVMTITK